MNIETQLFIGATTFGVASLILSLITFWRNRNQQFTVELGVEQIELLEDTLAETRQMLEESRKTVTDHSRRIAWLDAKVRQSRAVSKASRKTASPEEPRKSNIGEQRTRVLKLAVLGQDARTIAATLGMMPGEVELILNLSNHARLTV